MSEIITAAVIITLALIEIYCVLRLLDYVMTRSEARREAFRVQAYRDVNIRRSMTKNRMELWQRIRK